MDETDEVIIHAREELSDSEELDVELDWEEVNNDSLPLLDVVEMEAILKAWKRQFIVVSLLDTYSYL